MFGDEPAYGLAPDLRRYHVAALELAVVYLVAGALELGNDPAAAQIDREAPIACAVENEDPRGTLVSRQRNEAR